MALERSFFLLYNTMNPNHHFAAPPTMQHGVQYYTTTESRLMRELQGLRLCLTNAEQLTSELQARAAPRSVVSTSAQTVNVQSAEMGLELEETKGALRQKVVDMNKLNEKYVAVGSKLVAMHTQLVDANNKNINLAKAVLHARDHSGVVEMSARLTSMDKTTRTLENTLARLACKGDENLDVLMTIIESQLEATEQTVDTVRRSLHTDDTKARKTLRKHAAKMHAAKQRHDAEKASLEEYIASQATKWESENAALMGCVSAQDAEIATLKAQNAQLQASVTQLTEEKVRAESQVQNLMMQKVGETSEMTPFMLRHSKMFNNMETHYKNQIAVMQMAMDEMHQSMVQGAAPEPVDKKLEIAKKTVNALRTELGNVKKELLRMNPLNYEDLQLKPRLIQSLDATNAAPGFELGLLTDAFVNKRILEISERQKKGVAAGKFQNMSQPVTDLIDIVHGLQNQRRTMHSFMSDLVVHNFLRVLKRCDESDDKMDALMRGAAVGDDSSMQQMRDIMMQLS